MRYKFNHTYYLLAVKKVRQTEAPGCGKIARLIKVVFEVYRLDDEHKVVRCDEERIAQHVYLTLSEGHFWQTQDDHDSRFLEGVGLPPMLDLSVDLEKELTGRWIEGRPGYPGPDGFNPLEECKAIQSPVPAVFHPAPPASGVASTSVISLADSLASVECPSRQGTAGTSVHESISSEASDCSELLSELKRLPERIVQSIQPLIVSGGSNCVVDTSERPSPAAECAYRAYQMAEKELGDRIGDKDAYEWLRENGPDLSTPFPHTKTGLDTCTGKTALRGPKASASKRPNRPQHRTSVRDLRIG